MSTRPHPVAALTARSARLHYLWHSLRGGMRVKRPTAEHRGHTEAVGLLSEWRRARRLARRYASGLDQAGVYVSFVGDQRSGHSLVGSLLDAHPDAVVAHELNSLKYLTIGFGLQPTLGMIADNAYQFARLGRGESGYSYEVPGGWQGDTTHPLVIGDKDARRDTHMLSRYPDLIERWPEYVHPLELRLVHVVRNPYDNIATIVNRAVAGGRSGSAIDISSVAAQHLASVRSADRCERVLGSSTVVRLRHEHMCADPEGELRVLLRHIGLEERDDYLSRASAIVGSSPNRTRWSVDWPPEVRVEIDQAIAQLPCLSGYGFDE